MKKLLGITVLGLLLCSNAYAGWFSKLPVLHCIIDGHNITFDLRKFKTFESEQHKAKMHDWLIHEVTDDEYQFSVLVNHDDGRYHFNNWWVNRYTGVIDGWSGYKVRKGEPGAIKKSLTAEHNWNGTCKGVK